MKATTFYFFLSLFCIDTLYSQQESSDSTLEQTSEEVLERPTANEKLPTQPKKFSIFASNADSLIKDSESPIALGLSYSFFMTNGFVLTPQVSFSSNSKDKTLDDHTLTSENNKNVIIINDTENQEYRGRNLQFVIGKLITVSSKSFLQPYTGLGYSESKYKSNRRLTAANEADPNNSKCSSLFFNNCNFYELSNDYKNRSFNAILGVSFLLNVRGVTLETFAEYNYKQIKTTQDDTVQVQTKGSQGTVFSNSMISKAENPDIHVGKLGLGLRF